ncbi:MAG TPA: NAD-dependent succinate-semialdehyde dehydrogenase [Opitutaceae bacterium]|nr:NAD-dependent succinate-semialdehyde dehydrogenase [Opitutaceae bacterium]
MLVSVNPATGRRLAVYRTATRSDLERAVARADVAQQGWRRLTPRQRGTFVAALARELRVRRDALAALATDEMGKPVTQARGEVEKCAGLCDYYAANAPRLLREERPAGTQGRVVFEPLGIVLAIMPWNFPFWQVFRAAIPAIAGGNAVLLKHAPNVPGCALALAKVFERAGVPPGVFQSLPIGTQPVPGLIADSRIRGVTLTGSTRAGREVAALAGAAIKPAVLELGGSDPAIVLEDADLDRAVDLAAQARLLNSGQSCICAKRFIVVASIRGEFEKRFTARVAAARVGDPKDPRTEIGPLARADLRDHLAAQVRRSVRQGARVLLAGGPRRGAGFFSDPTVLGDVAPGMAAFDEETFGPLAAIVPARDEADAVRLANATRFGLGASVYTRNLARGRRVAAQLEAGCVFINDFVRSSPELPFGGIKDSGFGRELGRWGLQSFLNIKTVVGS